MNLFTEAAVRGVRGISTFGELLGQYSPSLVVFDDQLENLRAIVLQIDSGHNTGRDECW